MVASRTRGAQTDRHIGGLGFHEDSFSVGIEAELPFDRIRERGALRSARIALQRARRNQSEFEDTVILEVRSAIRQYRSAVSSFAIQKRIVESEEKNARVASLRFEEGCGGAAADSAVGGVLGGALLGGAAFVRSRTFACAEVSPDPTHTDHYKAISTQNYRQCDTRWFTLKEHAIDKPQVGLNVKVGHSVSHTAYHVALVQPLDTPD